MTDDIDVTDPTDTSTESGNGAKAPDVGGEAAATSAAPVAGGAA